MCEKTAVPDILDLSKEPQGRSGLEMCDRSGRLNTDRLKGYFTQNSDFTYLLLTVHRGSADIL